MVDDWVGDTVNVLQALSRIRDLINYRSMGRMPKLDVLHVS